MAISKRKLMDALRAEYIKVISEALTEKGEYVLVTGTAEIAFPVVDSEQGEHFIVVTVKVPTGTHDGEAYDGYQAAEDYRIEKAQKEKAKKEAEEKKQKKIAADKAKREAAAKAKAEAKAKAKAELGEE